MQNLILTLALGDNTTLLLTETDYTIVYAVETDRVTACEVILSQDKDYVYNNDEDGLHGSYLEENWDQGITLLNKSEAKQWAIDNAVDLGIITLEKHTDTELNTVSYICKNDIHEISRFDGYVDGYFFEGTISTPTHMSGNWYRGINVEDALLGYL